MKIFICSSKHFYGKIQEIKKELESAGHIITLPNSYEEPLKEEEMKKIGEKEHSKWKSERFREQNIKIKDNDALLILNFDKGENKNYIGGATFLEMFKAWELDKKIFLLNDVPDNILRDEIIGFNPIMLNGDLSKI